MTERRSTQRFELRVAIAFRRVPGLKENEVLRAETANISTGGMYFTTAQSLVLNEVLEFSLTFPRLAHGADVRVIGRARVLRVVQNSGPPSETAGVAVATEEYHILGLPGAA